MHVVSVLTVAARTQSSLLATEYIDVHIDVHIENKRRSTHRNTRMGGARKILDNCSTA